MAEAPALAHPLPGDPNYDPATDAPVILNLRGEYIEAGRWAGRYRIHGQLCDEWGNLMDEGACPGCNGARRVKQRTNELRPWESEMVPCPRCSAGSYEESARVAVGAR